MEADALRLMAVLAHPDDESLGVGGTLAAYAAQGVEVSLVTATRGERGRFYTGENRPSDLEVGKFREDELRRATRELGVRDVTILDYQDGSLDDADPQCVVHDIVAEIRRIRPHVVITFDPFGAYGHADHVAISQLTTTAVFAAAGVGSPDRFPPFAVSKFYYFVNEVRRWEVYQRAFKRMTSRVDGAERGIVAWPSWAVSAEIDTRPFVSTAWRAVCQHESQLAVYAKLGELIADEHDVLWGWGTFYRVFSRVNGGRARERDLFAGLR